MYHALVPMTHCGGPAEGSGACTAEWCTRGRAQRLSAQKRVREHHIPGASHHRSMTRNITADSCTRGRAQRLLAHTCASS